MLRVDPLACRPDDLAPAVEWLRTGGVVAFPTDTVYGLAVDPASDAAVRALFAMKGRGAEAALPFVAASRAQVETWCGLGEIEARLAELFWPGPLSLIRPAPASVVSAAHASLGTVAIRVPDHAVARALAEAWGSPVPATSANRTGAPPAIQASELVAWTSPHLLVIDGGPTPGSAPSTIVDARQRPPILVRPGAIAWNRVLHSIQA